MALFIRPQILRWSAPVMPTWKILYSQLVDDTPNTEILKNILRTVYISIMIIWCVVTRMCRGGAMRTHVTVYDSFFIHRSSHSWEYVRRTSPTAADADAAASARHGDKWLLQLSAASSWSVLSHWTRQTLTPWVEDPSCQKPPPPRITNGIPCCCESAFYLHYSPVLCVCTYSRIWQLLNKLKTSYLIYLDK